MFAKARPYLLAASCILLAPQVALTGYRIAGTNSQCDTGKGECGEVDCTNHASTCNATAYESYKGVEEAIKHCTPFNNRTCILNDTHYTAVQDCMFWRYYEDQNCLGAQVCNIAETAPHYCTGTQVSGG